jgi:hypothetical protein
MVSLADRSAATSALTAYKALRTPRRRLVRTVLALGLRSGLAQPVLRNRIDVGTAASATREQLADVLLTDHLCELLGRNRVFIAFGGGSGPYRKPVLQVFGEGGTPLGYVKVGWNDWTRDAIRREAAALRACAGSQMRIGVPALLDHSVWHHLDLLVTAPLPGGVRRLSRGWPLPDVSLIREISELSPHHVGELATSPWWLGIRARIQTNAADSESHSALALLTDRIERWHGRTRLEFGSWHGDFVPWNLARLGPRVYAWDWESSAPDAPLGFDALHFHFQVAFVARRHPVQEAAALAARKARSALDALGVARDTHSLVAILHLLELFVRHEEARSSTGDLDERFYPAVTHVLERALEPGYGAAAVHYKEVAS